MTRITQPTVPCHVPAEAEEDILLGVDTHKDVHAAAVITTLGACRARKVIAVGHTAYLYSLMVPPRTRVRRSLRPSRSWTGAGCPAASGGLWPRAR